MNPTSLDRPIREENVAALLRRWRLVCQDEKSRFDVNLDFDTTAVLRAMTEEEVRLAASTLVPLFGLSVDDYGLKNILEERNGRELSQVELKRADETFMENEDFLLNLWSAPRLSDNRSRIRYALSPGTAMFLTRATIGDLRKIAGNGHSLCSLQVRPQYLWQAGKAKHLGDAQRDSMAFSANKKNSI